VGMGLLFEIAQGLCVAGPERGEVPLLHKEGLMALTNVKRWVEGWVEAVPLGAIRKPFFRGKSPRSSSSSIVVLGLCCVGFMLAAVTFLLHQMPHKGLRALHQQVRKSKNGTCAYAPNDGLWLSTEGS
jgi:hypothetical protein